MSLIPIILSLNIIQHGSYGVFHFSFYTCTSEFVSEKPKKFDNARKKMCAILFIYPTAKEILARQNNITLTLAQKK